MRKQKEFAFMYSVILYQLMVNFMSESNFVDTVNLIFYVWKIFSGKTMV